MNETYLSSIKPYLSTSDLLDNIPEKLGVKQNKIKDYSVFDKNLLTTGSSIINGITSGLTAKKLIKEKEDQRAEMFEKAKQYAKLQKNINQQFGLKTTIFNNDYSL